MDKDEALKLALEALETTGAKSSDQWQKERKAITAIKQALAAQQEHEPENEPYVSLASVQEPVAWMHEWDDGERVPMLRKRDVDSSDIDSPKSVRPLVFGDTTPPAAQPAPTVQEQSCADVQLAEQIMSDCGISTTYRQALVDRIANRIASHRPAQPAPSCPECVFGLCHCGLRKSPPAQPAPVQEPVAYLFTNVQSGDIEASTNPDHKEGEREMWYREPLVRPPTAQPAAPVQEPDIERWLGHPRYHDGFGRSPDLWSLAQIKAAVTAMLSTPPAAQPAPVQEPVGRVCFEGDAEESAKVFIDWIARSFAGRLEDERKAEREACAKVCEDEICSCCWDDEAKAAAEHLAAAIRARGNT